MFRKLLNKTFYKPSQEQVDKERRLIEEEIEFIDSVAKALRLPNRKDIDSTLSKEE